MFIGRQYCGSHAHLTNPCLLAVAAMTNDQNELFILKQCNALNNALAQKAPAGEMSGDLNVLFGQLKQRAMTKRLLSDEVAKRVIKVVSNPCFQGVRPNEWRRILFLCFSPILARNEFPEIDEKDAHFKEVKKTIRSIWDDAISRKLPGSYGCGKRH